MKCSDKGTPAVRRLAVEKADYRQSGLLRTRREWPSGRAAEQRNEITPFHVCRLRPRITPYHMEAVLCITANLGADWQLRVIFVRLTRSRRSRHVRFAPIASQPSHRSESTRCANSRHMHCSKI